MLVKIFREMRLRRIAPTGVSVMLIVVGLLATFLLEKLQGRSVVALRCK